MYVCVRGSVCVPVCVCVFQMGMYVCACTVKRTDKSVTCVDMCVCSHTKKWCVMCVCTEKLCGCVHCEAECVCVCVCTVKLSVCVCAL